MILSEKIQLMIESEINNTRSYEELGYIEGTRDIEKDQWSDVVSGIKALNTPVKNRLEAIAYAKGYFRAMEEHIELFRKKQEQLQSYLNHEINKFDHFVQNLKK